jgi:two-component system CheB/CheR fusion protein
MESFVVELEMANEELNSRNEDLKSSNEELQTSNEELQTSNEQLQIAYNQLRISNEKLVAKDKQLEESEANLKALLDNTLQSFILVDKDFKVIAFNQKAQINKKLYLNKTINYGTSIIDLIAPDIMNDYIENIRRCLQGEHITVEYHFLGLNNESLWFRYNFTPISSTAGDAEAVSISSLNITDEKNYLLSHQKSENMINSIFNATETGICVTDHQGRFVKVNEGYARLYKYKREELIGQMFSIVVQPEQRQLAEKLHADFIAGKEEMPGEWQVIKKDGTLMDIYASARRLLNPDGSLLQSYYGTGYH